MVSDWLSSYCRIFRDVPSDITIDVNGGTFALHKVSYFAVIYSEFVQQVMYIVMNLASCSAWNFSSFFFFLFQMSSHFISLLDVILPIKAKE